MEDNGAWWNITEWNKMEKNETYIHFHCLVSYDVTECCFHSIVWKVNRAEQVIIF
jgi:hypothetical protein